MASSAPGISFGNARAHQHVVHAGEHGAVERRQGGQLDLGEQVDADQAVVPLLREPHLDERRQHRRSAGAALLTDLLVHRQQLVGRSRRPDGPRAGSSASAPARPRRASGTPPSPGARARRGRRPAAAVRTRSRWRCPRRRRADPGAIRRCARRQSDTAMPMPPWMMVGKVRVSVMSRPSAGEGAQRTEIYIYHIRMRFTNSGPGGRGPYGFSPARSPIRFWISLTLGCRSGSAPRQVSTNLPYHRSACSFSPLVSCSSPSRR